MGSGKSVRLFLVNGTPGGIITAEIMNWTGHAIAASRSDLDVLVKRSELTRTGVYILIGENPDNPLEQMAYIGEGDAVKARLYQHAKKDTQSGKDFWTRVVVFTNKDANLTKAHARFLESRLITMAATAKRAKLVNGTSPDLPLLPEADISDMNYYISQVEIILPLLGINILRSPKTVTPRSADVESPSITARSNPVFEMRIHSSNILARAQEVDGEFIVLAGSEARSGWSGRSHGYKRLKNELERNGTIRPAKSGANSEFIQDRVFSSPSAAAAVVAGRTANGRIDWKVVGTNLTYGAWQDQKLDDSAGPNEINQADISADSHNNEN